MKHFIDHYQIVKKQTFDTAIITNSKGKIAGKIIVRYTDSQIGYNNETGILLYAADLDFGNTLKGDTHNKENVFRLLRSVGAKVYDHSGSQFGTYSDKNRSELRMADSVSQCRDFVSFKIGNSKYKIHWI